LNRTQHFLTKYKFDRWFHQQTLAGSFWEVENPFRSHHLKYAKFIPKNVIFDKGTSRYTYYYQVSPLGVKTISQN
jgi:hypothetical protein